MNVSVMRILYWSARFLGLMLSASIAFAGGSGLNVVVVVNQASSNSIQLGNDYCEKRGVPPQNVFRMTGWGGGGTNWYLSDFETFLRQPLLGMLASRGLTNQAQFLLLSMDIPYRVLDQGSQNSSTSALFYGFKYDGTNSPDPNYPSCSLPDSSSNSYAFSETPLGSTPPDTADTNSFLAMMLTENTFAGAESVLASGLNGDSTFPTQTVYLAKTSDGARNVRFMEFDDAIFDARLNGNDSLVWLNSDSLPSTNLLGLMTGFGNFSLPPATFIPGAFGDSLTSYAGALFDNIGQTLLFVFLDTGGAGSYGTVVEPCNYLQKFPHPLDYFYQSRGFSLAEAYYMGLLNPYQGVLVGEPLSAPFARLGSSNWSSLTNGTVISGQVPLSLSFSAARTNLPLAQADLFVDGTFLRTLTNVPPTAGNSIAATLNGFTAHYIVPANSSASSVVTGLAAAVNALSNSSDVVAFPSGDRLEFQSVSLGTPGSSVNLNTTASVGTGASLTTQVLPARANFLDTTATGRLDALAENPPAVGDWLQLDFYLTNGAQITVAVTNTSPSGTIGMLVQSLISLVNAQPALQAADGVLASDFYDYGTAAQLSLYARSLGWPAAEIQAVFSAATNLVVLPTGLNKLEDNLNDLRPRNQLFLSSGVTNLPVNFTLNTTQLADGYHELAVVAYEGTSVRTQTRATRQVRIQNTSLNATFAANVTGTNATLDYPLQFSVSANQGSITSIQLFGTGGLLSVVSNEQSAVFSVASGTLGLGLHPFYAVVTSSSGQQYRTQTISIRLVPSIPLSISPPPFVLSWSSSAGLSYDVLAATNLLTGFQTVATVTASGQTTQWPVSAPGGTQAFYRIRLRP